MANIATPREIKAVIKNFLARLDADIGAVEEFLSPDCSAHLPGQNVPLDRNGFKGFAGMLYAAFPDLHHEVTFQIAEGDEVASLVAVRGTHKGNFQDIPPTQKQVEFTDIILARVHNGKITVLWAQFDALGLFRQLGMP